MDRSVELYLWAVSDLSDFEPGENDIAILSLREDAKEYDIQLNSDYDWVALFLDHAVRDMDDGPTMVLPHYVLTVGKPANNEIKLWSATATILDDTTFVLDATTAAYLGDDAARGVNHVLGVIAQAFDQAD